MTPEKSLILLRGLPGAGKSTLASVLSGKEDCCFSIDDYFTDDEGTYLFDHTRNHLAYEQCQERTAGAMARERKRIFVHNTFTMDWEMLPYRELAGRYGYRLFVVTVENYHEGTNTHDISREQVEKMAAKYRTKLL